jgi:hypothetical protein
MSWSRRFDDPIPTAGKPLLTLRDAADLIRRLPRAEHDLPHWQVAGRILIAAAEEREPIMHARIAMLRALNAGKPDPKLSPRKKRAKTYRIIR